MSVGKKKQVCGSEGPVVGRDGTLLFLWVGIFRFFVFHYCCKINAVQFFRLAYNGNL